VAPDGSAQRDFGACSERWTNATGGGEVAYRFPARPPGDAEPVNENETAVVRV